jgi:hypothetical protein
LVSISTHAGVGTIIQDYRYLGEGKQLALRTELFCTYMEPLSRVSRGKAGEADTGKRDYRYQERICRTIRKCTVLCYILVRIFFGFITFLGIVSGPNVLS